MIEHAHEGKAKDCYISKLEKQIKEMNKHFNNLNGELKESLDQKTKEIEENKQGLKQVLQVVNQNKKLIIEDII